jgi:dephospho-CoA kinase
MSDVLRVGLTGGIGSGKSTVAGMLSCYGAKIIDADAISRSLTEVGGVAVPSIAKAFGSLFINDDGAMDRDKMRELIYGDAHARQVLEGIIHPLVGAEIQRQTAFALENLFKVVIFDIPLLVESPVWRGRVDHVVVIDSPNELQIERVMARSGLTRQEVEKIIASQANRQRRLSAADTVICNMTQSLSQLGDEVRDIANRFGLSWL